MYVCPLCNQLTEFQHVCQICHIKMEDKGRIIDYFDDYSAYLDIDDMKLFDGYPKDKQEQECPHLFYCGKCGNEQTLLIKEIAF